MKDNKRLDKQLEEEFAEDVMELKAKLEKVVKGGTQESVGPSRVSSDVKKSPLRIIIPAIAVAASLALAIIFLPGILDSGSEDLYAANYEIYPMALNQRGDSNELMNDAVASYINKDFDTSSVAFRSLWEESKNPLYMLYHGTSLQELGDYSGAIVAYDVVIQSKDMLVMEQAQWYKALALWKLDRKEEANVLLESFSKDHHKYGSAIKILAR